MTFTIDASTVGAYTAGALGIEEVVIVHAYIGMIQFQFVQGVIHFHVDDGRVQRRLYGCGVVVVVRVGSAVVG